MYDGNNQRTGPEFGYSTNGDVVTNRGVGGFTYDAADRLTEVAPPGYRSMFRAGYWGDGLRAWKDVGGSTPKAWFVYDGDTLVYEMDGASVLLAMNISSAPTSSKHCWAFTLSFVL